MTDAHWFAIRIVLAALGGAIILASYIYAMEYMEGHDGAFVIMVGFLIGLAFFTPGMMWGFSP